MSKNNFKKICLRYNFIFPFLCCLSVALFLCTGCSSDAGESGTPLIPGISSGGSSSTAKVTQASAESMNSRYADLPVPAPKGTQMLGNETISIDISDISMGYYHVTYLGNNSKVKMQVTGPDQIKYTYNLPSSTVCLPISGGNGEYNLALFENISGDQYASAFKGSFSVSLENEFYPFLYSNMYVNYDNASAATNLAKSLADGVSEDLEYINKVYHYIIENITYDDAKAENVAYNYIPDIDTVLQTKKGICFDYASLMAGMLRSRHIPTRLQIGYAGEAYHAWISVYIEDIGWIDNIIRFDGTSWSLMDPTFAANGKNSSSIKKFIGDGSNYNVLYTY